MAARCSSTDTGYVSSDVTVRYHVHDGQVTDDLIKTFDAYAAVVDAYRDRAVAFALRRRAVRDAAAVGPAPARPPHGRPPGRARAARGILRDPWKARALVDLLGYRLRLQRRRWGYTRGRRADDPASGPATPSSSPRRAAARAWSSSSRWSRAACWAGLGPVLRRPAGADRHRQRACASRDRARRGSRSVARAAARDARRGSRAASCA